MVDPMNALAPMRSLEGQDRAGTVREGDDREKSVSEAVQEEVERRQTKAVQELQAKYASGRGGDDASENGPTGHAYTAAAVAERDRRKGLKDRQSANDEATAQKEAFREAEVRAMHRAAQGESDEEDGQGAAEDLEEDSDEEYLRDLDDDPELAKIRNARMLDIKVRVASCIHDFCVCFFCVRDCFLFSLQILCAHFSFLFFLWVFCFFQALSLSSKSSSSSFCLHGLCLPRALPLTISW